MAKFNVIVIGAGAVGSAVARELSKYELSVAVVEKSLDIGGDASRSNSAIIHTGYDASPGSLESQLVVAANPMYPVLTQELDIPFRRVGAILPAVTEEQAASLPAIKHKAFMNHVYDVEYVSRERLLELEPEVNPAAFGGLYIPRESIIDPFLLVVALAENAYDNGVQFFTNTKATGIKVEDGCVRGVMTDRGFMEADFVVNAAGLYCDEVARMVGVDDFTVNPRKGQFYIMDKNAACNVSRIVLPVPTKLTKGKLAAPTIHGNMLIGPTAEDLTDKTDKATTRAGLDEVIEGVKKLIPNVNAADTITQYAGLRPNRNPEGLRLEFYDHAKGFVGLSGVRSTGVTASVSLGKYLAEAMFERGLPSKLKENFNPRRVGIKKFASLSEAEQRELIQENPRYGHVICRCETVTEAEIIEAIRRPLGAKTLDGVKRRVWAGAGRCQGGFCGPRVIEILARELGISVDQVCKDSSGSALTAGKAR